MNIDELANEAVSALAERLPAGIADSLTTLVTERLNASKTGARALTSLRGNPGEPQAQELAGNVLADELARDPSFAALLAEALGRPTTQISSVSVGERSTIRGDVAGGNIDKSKRFHIGSIRFGGGGLTALILFGVLGAGGAGVGVYNAVVAPSYAKDAAEGFKVGVSGNSVDFDEVNSIKAGGDKVADVTIVGKSLTATGGGQLALLAAGVVPSADICATALQKHVKTLEELKPADVFCLRTSQDAITAVTISAMRPAGNSTIFSFNYAYWRRV